MRHTVLSSKLWLLLLVAGVLLFAQAFAEQLEVGPRKNLFKVDEIQIEGTRKVEREAILEKIAAKVGMVIDNHVLGKDIKKIYSLKYFEYVEAHQKVVDGKNILLFKVQEKPIITRIVIKGNNEIDEEDLVTQLKTKEFSILDINTIKVDITALQKHYEEKGFYLATVSYEIKPAEKKENVELIFKVKEYDKVRVKQVIFLGNRAFQDLQLKDIMETREESLFSFMSGTGNFREFNFQTDIERIKYFYKTKGYLQVNVGTPEITVSEDKKWVFITIKINEGPQFSINDIHFQGEVLFEDGELLKKISLKKGEVYSEERLRQDIQLLTEMYQDEGYAFANVLRTLEVIPGENKVDVDFSFEKGKIAHFGVITMKGNTKTRDKVIRRELMIREGARFSGSSLRRSKENVNRLGFFEPGSVVFNTVSPKGKDDVLDVEITVKERNTGQISLGAGYSTATGEFIQASIAQNNFMGLGQNLSFSFSHSGTQQTFNLGFTEPYLFDTKWTAGGDIFLTQQESTSVEYKKRGFDLRVGYPVWDYTRVFLTYKLVDTQIDRTLDLSIDKDLENGIASSVESTIVKDKRNNKFEPTGGHYASASVEYAGLGGDKKWLKSEVDGRYYQKVYGDLVLRTRLLVSKLDHVDAKPIPRTEKFTLGGARNLRGYNIEAIGPHAETLDKDNKPRSFNTGGLFSLVTSFELEHPLAREAGLKWVLFFDAGNVYEKYIGKEGDYDLKADYGFGFRWFSPIGVLRFEFGYPLNPGPKDAGSQFHFDIGQLF